MKRGEVWWVNLDPTIGTEINKTRTAVIISNDSSNKFLNRVEIIPLTSNVDACYPSEAIIAFIKKSRIGRIGESYGKIYVLSTCCAPAKNRDSGKPHREKSIL